MGRIHDALKKAAEERERKRRHRPGDPSAEIGDAALRIPIAPEVPVKPRAAAEAAPRREAVPAATTGFALPVIETARTTGFAAVAAELPPAPAAGGRGARKAAPSRVERALERSGQALRDGKGDAPQRARGPGSVDERIVVFHEPRDRRTEQFRKLRANLLSLEDPPRTILLAASSSEQGTDLTAMNLAATFAEDGRHRSLVVDANLRTPGLHELVGARPAPGLADALLEDVQDLGPLVQETAIRGVFVLPAGNLPENPGRLLKPLALRRVFDGLAASFDSVIIDTPPTDEFADAALMAPETDGAIVVVRLEGAAKAGSERTIDALESARARILGAFVTTIRGTT